VTHYAVYYTNNADRKREYADGEMWHKRWTTWPRLRFTADPSVIATEPANNRRAVEFNQRQPDICWAYSYKKKPWQNPLTRNPPGY